MTSSMGRHCQGHGSLNIHPAYEVQNGTCSAQACSQAVHPGHVGHSHLGIQGSDVPGQIGVSPGRLQHGLPGSGRRMAGQGQQ